jgi:hypothetical protein
MFIEHDGKTVLVQSSAGLKNGSLDGQHADVIFLGVGTPGKLDQRYQQDYWHEVH